MTHSRVIILATLALLILAPLTGGLLAGLPRGFGHFPPLVHVQPFHPVFSWPVYLPFAAAALGAALILVFPRPFGIGGLPAAGHTPTFSFPVWGWIGLGLNVLSWALAWGRFDWAGRVNDHTFFPLWLGYVLIMDGLVYRRRGASMLSRAPAKLVTLFPVSAVTWWYFEYLNRFVQNWWYQGTTHFTAFLYIGHATLCFSTVLPAIFETFEWLRTFPGLCRRYENGPAVSPLNRTRRLGLLAFGTGALVVLAAWPTATFFLTWLAPLALLYGGLELAGVRSPLGDVEEGEYGRAVMFALAALVCGFFWELWNFWSLPKWNYDVPYVNRFHLFEMPAVGYAGYLPFGPICWCFWLAFLHLLPGRLRAKLSA